MAQIIKFPKTQFKSLRVRQGAPFRVSVKVLDFRRPKATRWAAQFAIQRAAGFRALKGFKDGIATWHRFEIRMDRLLVGFMRDVAPLIEAGRIDVCVQGRRVSIRLKEVA